MLQNSTVSEAMYGIHGSDLNSFLKNIERVNRIRNDLRISLSNIKLAKELSRKNLKEYLAFIKIKHDFNILNSNLEYYIPSNSLINENN